MEEDIDQIAAAWLVRMHSDQCTIDDARALDKWLSDSPENAAAYANHLALWQGIGSLKSSGLARSMLSRDSAVLYRRTFPWSDRTIKFANAAAAAIVIFMLAFTLRFFPLSVVYKTVPGEQRTVELKDGSRVMLNTDSRLRVRLEKSERRLVLEQGEAFFQVAKDVTRPFRVFVGRDEVRAVGTEFEIRKEGSSAQVILEEGVVAVYRGDENASLQSTPIASATHREPSALLKPGQQARFAATGPITVTNADLSRVNAWREGRIVIEDMSLIEAIAEVNRYGGPEIVLGDPRVGTLKVSGVFHAGHPEDFLEAITRAFPLRIVSDGGRRIVLTDSERSSAN